MILTESYVVDWKFEPYFLTWLPNRKIEKITVYPLFFSFIQFSTIEIRSVFSHTKLFISWLQRMEKKMGSPCSLVSYSHFSTDRAHYQGKSAMFSMRMHERAVRMHNANVRNDLNIIQPLTLQANFLYPFFHSVFLHWEGISCLRWYAYCVYKYVDFLVLFCCPIRTGLVKYF